MNRSTDIFPAITSGVLFCLLYFVFTNIFLQTPLFICDQPHDFFIPINAGYAFKNGYSLHENFHTPFGWLYPAINALALSIIELFPDILSLNGFISISSLIFSFSITAVFSIIYCLHPKQFRSILFLLLVFALSVNFQFKSRTDWTIFDVAPVIRSIYNNHLWGLFLFQVAHAFLLLKIKNDRQFLEKREIIIAAALQALILYIFLSYKINFFLGGLLISAILIILMPIRQSVSYIMYGAVIFFGFMATTWLLGYSYNGYFQDILTTIEAKKEIYKAYTEHADFINKLATVPLLFDYRQPLQTLLITTSLFLYYIYQRTNRFNLKNISLCLKEKEYLVVFVFLFSIFFAFYVALQGDYDKPHLYLGISSLIFILINPIPKFHIIYYRLAHYILLFLVFINIFSIISATKANNQTIAGYHFSDFHITAQNSKHNFQIKTTDRDNISPPKLNDKLLTQDAMVFESYKTENPNFIDYIENTAQNDLYIKMLTDVMSTLSSVDISEHEKLFLLEFTNPLPFLTNSKIPANSFNWLHAGVTISIESLPQIRKNFIDSDAVIIPAKSIDGNAQQLMNCEFYEWNFNQNEPLKVFKISENAIYLGTDNFLQKHKLKQVYNFDNVRTLLPETCANVKKQLKEFLWTYPS